MATWDSSDLLARAKRRLNRPSTDAALGDADLYAFATEGQHHWMQQLALFVPETNYGAPELMTTGDGGYTYSVAYEPLYMEVKKNRTASFPMVPGEEWDSGADFVQEGKTIRRPNNQQFSEAPYARYVRAPAEIAAGTEPIMKPDYARILIVQYMVVQAARRLKMDASQYQAEMDREWWGNPLTGQPGILAQLKARFGVTPPPTGPHKWWQPQ
jgi:hypothetical protein